MEFNKLEYIIKVAELGNITKASEELYMTQPALSHFLTKVEKEEGVKLFDRTTSPITLTYEGEKYIETAKKILELNSQLKEEMAQVTSSRKGRIRIGIPPLRAAGMLPKFLPVYTEQFPLVEFQTVEHNSRQLREDVLKGSVDFAVLPLLGNFKEFECIPLCKEEMVLVSRMGKLDKSQYTESEDSRRIVDITKLKDEKFVLLGQGHGSRGAMDILFELHGYKPKIFMETTNNETAFGLAAVGLGLAVVPVSTVETIRHDYPIEIYHLSEEGYYWDVAAICKSGYKKRLLVRECIEMMQEVFGN